MGSLLRAVLIASTLTIIIYPADCANILFFFIGGTYSHKLSIWPLACSLADRGHNVTLFSTYKKQPRPHPLVADLTSESISSFVKTLPPWDSLKSRRRRETLQQWRSGFGLSLSLCEAFMSNADSDPVLRYLVHDARFDLVINNAVISDCGYILAHRYGAKLIISSSTVVLPWYSELFGVPSEASWVPDWSSESTYPMGWVERWTSWYMPSYYYAYRLWWFYPQLERIAQRAYGNDSRDLSVLEMERNASLVLVHTHFSTGFPRSHPPMFIDVGGMQCWEAEGNLSRSLKHPLDTSKRVVLVSFGTTIDASLVNDPLKDVLMGCMRALPKFQFVIRGNASSGHYPDNVFASEWLPQREILNHPNVIAFITHGGLNGLAEATYAGVPLIVVPLFADQDYNAYRIEMQSLGLRLELRELTTEKLVQAVHAVAENVVFRDNMRKMSKAFRERPLNPIEVATFWTEFALRNDDLRMMMRPGSADLSWFRRHIYDVIIPFCAAVLLCLILLGYLIAQVLIATVSTMLKPSIGAILSSGRLSSQQQKYKTS